MNHLKCIPVLLGFFFSVQLLAQHCDQPTIIHANSVDQIHDLRFMCHDCNHFPDSGTIIITDDHGPGENVLSLNATKSYTFIFYPKNHNIRYYWTLWIDFNDDNVIDKASEIFRVNGKGIKNIRLKIPRGIEGIVKQQYIMSRGKYHMPCDKIGYGDYYFSEINWVQPKSNTKKSLQVQKLDIQLFPNPVTDRLNVTIDGNTLKQDASMTLFDAAGAIVLESLVTMQKGTTKVNFDVDNLPRGLYYLGLKTDSESTMQTVVLQ